MSYNDDGLSDHERIRWLAIQQTKQEFAPDRIKEAEQIAAFILGPEARKPAPLQQLADLAETVKGLLGDSTENAWTPDETVAVNVNGLHGVYRELLTLSEEEPPF